MQRIETKSLHKGVAGARHTFLKQQPGQDKLNLLLQVRCHLVLSCTKKLYSLHDISFTESSGTLVPLAQIDNQRDSFLLSTVHVLADPDHIVVALLDRVSASSCSP